MIKKNTEIKLNTATAEEIEKHLLECDDRFDPPLSSRVNITAYAVRLVEKAVTIEAYSRGELSALVAVYCNREFGNEAFISNVSVLRTLEGSGVASRLMVLCINYARENKFPAIALEVSEKNERAVRFYTKFGFETESNQNGLLRMKLQF